MQHDENEGLQPVGFQDARHELFLAVLLGRVANHNFLVGKPGLDVQPVHVVPRSGEGLRTKLSRGGRRSRLRKGEKRGRHDFKEAIADERVERVHCSGTR